MLGRNGIENGVNVVYTGKNLYHLDGKGSYDAKISSNNSGGNDYYETNDGWATHGHDVYNRDGSLAYHRDANEDPEKHPWTHRDDD